jgi:hypothetical protein
VLLCEREELPVLVIVIENETNEARIFNWAGGTPFPKDGINDCVVHGRQAAVNPERIGTKGTMHREVTIPPGGSSVLRLRLRDVDIDTAPFGAEFERCFEARQAEADAFYRAVAPAAFTEDEAQVYRQALSGMLWSGRGGTRGGQCGQSGSSHGGRCRLRLRLRLRACAHKRRDHQQEDGEGSPPNPRHAGRASVGLAHRSATRARKRGCPFSQG